MILSGIVLSLYMLKLERAVNHQPGLPPGGLVEWNLRFLSVKYNFLIYGTHFRWFRRICCIENISNELLTLIFWFSMLVCRFQEWKFIFFINFSKYGKLWMLRTRSHQNRFLQFFFIWTAKIQRNFYFWYVFMRNWYIYEFFQD